MPLLADARSAVLAEFLTGVELPSLPEVVRELVATMAEEDLPVERIRKAIRSDPSLTAKLLRLANSARFGLRRQVGSLEEAVALVGMNQLRTLAMAACMSGSFAMHGLDGDTFWRESMAVAGYAQWLAPAVGEDGQQAWLAGFMARLGEVIIAQKAPGHIDEIEGVPHVAGGRWARESALLGFAETEVTASLALRWDFPPGIVRALETAFVPLAAQPFCRLGGVVHVSALLAGLALYEHKTDDAAIDALPPALLSALGLETDWLKMRLPDVQNFVDVAIA